MFEVAIDAGPERRVFDERRRVAPLRLVVRTEGLGRSTWRMPAKFCRETPRGRDGGQSAAARGWIRRSAARQRNAAKASSKTTGVRQRR